MSIVEQCLCEEITNNASKVSGTGAYACQLAKKVFHADKVITTVSTSKIDQVPKLLGEGIVDLGMYLAINLF